MSTAVEMEQNNNEDQQKQCTSASTCSSKVPMKDSDCSQEEKIALAEKCKNEGNDYLKCKW